MIKIIRKKKLNEAFTKDEERYSNSVTAPDKTIINENEFENCSGLFFIKVPKNIEKVEGGAFSECRNLTKVTFMNDNTEIEEYAFYGCTGLDKVILPKNLKKIESHTFFDCGLSSIDIPETVSSIEQGAFDHNQWLKAVKIPKNVKILPRDVFAGCASLTDVSLPDNLEEIGKCAFIHNERLTDIKWPKNIKHIDERAFWDCGFTNITLPDGLEHLGQVAFGDCKNLKSITIPASVTKIDSYDGGWADWKCPNLKYIFYLGKKEVWDTFNISSKRLDPKTKVLFSKSIKYF